MAKFNFVLYHIYCSGVMHVDLSKITNYYVSAGQRP